MSVPRKISDQIRMSYQSLLHMGYELPAGKWQGVDTYEGEYMLELMNHDIKMIIPDDIPKLHEQTHCDVPWAEKHFQERINLDLDNLNPGQAYLDWPYAKLSEDAEFKRHEGKFSHTYMERFFHNGSINALVQILRDNPTTRQAYFPIFDHGDVIHATQGNRIPCTLGYLFILRGDYLNINYYIRSCDAFRHFHNDIYLTARLCQYVVHELGRWHGIQVTPGVLSMYIGSFHIFKNDKYHIEKRLKKWFN